MSESYLNFALSSVGYGSVNETELNLLSPRSRINRKISDDLEKHLLNLNISYILTVGVSGLVLCTIGSDLKFIAEHVGMNVTIVGGNAFLARGIGSIFGATFSTPIYKIFEGDKVLICGLIGITTLLLFIPSVVLTQELYLSFFLLGFCSAVNDTGCNIMTRKIRGKQAGPWLGANGISFGMSSAIVPVIELISNDFATQYYIIAGIIALITLMFLYRIQEQKDLPEEEHLELKRQDTFYRETQSQDFRVIDRIAPHYYVEITVGIILFCLIGGQVVFMAYIIPYVNQSHILPPETANSIISLFWILATTTRILGVWDQHDLTDSTLVNHLSSCCFLGSIGLLLLVLFQNNVFIFYLGVSVYALTYGPTVSYCYDLNNRLTLPTEQSSSICLFGLNCGASFVPFITACVWQYFGNNPVILTTSILLSMLLPIPLIFLAPRISYNDELKYFHLLRANTLYPYNRMTNRIEEEIHGDETPQYTRPTDPWSQDFSVSYRTYEGYTYSI